MNLSRKFVAHICNRCLTMRSMHLSQCIYQKSKPESSPFDDPGHPRVALSKDRRTIVMYHPEEMVKYEDTLPIPRHDPRYSANETADDILKYKLEKSGFSNKTVERPSRDNILPITDKEVIPAAMELSELFYTTKHKWTQHRNVKLAKEKIDAMKEEENN
ncbi:large ribosomal subunit protein mL42-like [Ciona intestinalis]